MPREQPTGIAEEVLRLADVQGSPPIGRERKEEEGLLREGQVVFEV